MACTYILDTGMGYAAYGSRARAERAGARFKNHMMCNGAYDDEVEVEVRGVREGQPFGFSEIISKEAQDVLMEPTKPLPPGTLLALDDLVKREGSLQFRHAKTGAGVVFEPGPDGRYKRFEGRTVSREEMVREVTEDLAGGGWALVAGCVDSRELGPIATAPRPAPAFRDALVAP